MSSGLQRGSQEPLNSVEQPSQKLAAVQRPPKRQNAVTLRAILVGLLLCAVGAICFPYTDNVVRGSTLAEDHTVEAGEIGGRFGRGDDVVRRQHDLGVGRINCNFTIE